MFSNGPASRFKGFLALFFLTGFFSAGCASGPPPMPAPTIAAAADPSQPEVVPEAPAAEAPAPAPAPVPSDPALDTVRAGVFDNGKMWTFEYPPLDYLRETYGFTAEEEWFERAHLGALRIPGCTASFVSPDGLVMTNHHCARESIEQVRRDGEDLIADGFYAATLEDERPIEDYWADQLIEVRDVTDRVYAALEGVFDPQAKAERRQQVTDEIIAEVSEEFGGEEAGYLVEMIGLYAGARFSVYIFKHYTDLRLVMSPELQLASFGGDWDNFTYPRYDLDMSFYRIYGDDGEPLETENYFPFSSEGVEDGDLIFVIGNPGGSSRLQTVAELEYRRDVSDQAVVDLLTTRIANLKEFAESHPEVAQEMDLRNEVFSLENSLKAYSGIVKGLHDPVVIAKRKDHERKFSQAIAADPALQAEFGGLISRMAELQALQREYAAENASFLAVGHPTMGSATLNRGLAAYQYLAASSGGAPAELVAEIRTALISMPDQPRELNEAQLIERLNDFVRNFGADHPFTQEALQGRTPEGAAAVLMSRSALADSASTAAAVEGGTLDISDPGVLLAQAIIQSLTPSQMAQQAVGPEAQEISSALGRALFGIYGTDVPPDATFSLRIADGVVTDYEYNGTIAPVFTTFFGLYDHFYSYGPDTFWDLPERWRTPPAGLDLSTPMNFVSTADIIGGNSGSPVLNRNLEVVGLAFDGNIESLPGDYIYLPEVNRCVSVDARGILEALEEVYQAERLVRELTAGRTVR